MKKNKHIGSNFDDFLAEEGMLDEIEEVVAKKIFVFQIEIILVVIFIILKINLNIFYTLIISTQSHNDLWRISINS